MSDYKMFNPYQHLTRPYRLTVAQWTHVKSQLSDADLANIENGGSARLGSAKVWKVGTRWTD